MYSIFLPNFGYSINTQPSTLDNAIEIAVGCGYNAHIYLNKPDGQELIAAYSPISGLRFYKENVYKDKTVNRHWLQTGP
jgi:hypothetical protein